MTRTLLLNATYQPLGTINWQRAVCLMSLDKVELLEAYDRQVRSVSMVLPVPSVLRLRRFVRPWVARVRFSRQNIYARDHHRCQYCRQEFALSQLTLDHVMPRRRGGPTEWTNIVTACAPCNTYKADRTPAEAGLILAKPPRQPTWLPMIKSRDSSDPTPEAWRGYMGWVKGPQYV